MGRLNLGLGEAAKRGVGTGVGQIPDMGSFQMFPSDAGWQKLPGGIVLQWGVNTVTGAQGKMFTFPIAFPQRCFQIVVSDGGSGSFAGGAAPNSPSVFSVWIDSSRYNPATVVGYRYIAIGY